MQKFIIHICDENFDFKFLENFECFLLAQNLDSHFIFEFINLAHKKNKLVLTTSVVDCLAYSADGVLLDLSKSENIKKDYFKQTQNLKNKFIGVICRNRRHEAMLVSECEPDFVVFRAWADGIQKVKELTDWYSEMFLIQSALLLVEDVPYQTFKTDFIIIKPNHIKNAG